ncbi:alpha/beta fold hydrolase [Nocardiopsis composta]|uniref:Pimeloyl-ACP methyl ester carboxylesterase n=1 Tax=Nocardiopsis composta TaxID=157465 RepID=A0A7W8VG77_9ACTN|nr:alpha/beta fold hydrolase [Nocardiopsis composta]MBB5435356.1 pimeloyl-ACP methyl ester carboxylesterase [Nocardiopsis composta]
MPMLRVNGLNLHYEQEGKGPPVLFVHGSVLNGAMTWSAQQPLAERWSLIVIDRPGFGASSPVDRVDFAADAESVAALLDRSEELWGVDRVHLVGHSDGGVVSLLAAAARPEALASLTVIEPPAFGVAADHPAVRGLVTRLKDHWRHGPRGDPGLFLRAFLELAGSEVALPDPLPPPLEQGAAMLVAERGPWEARIPLQRLARAPFPGLVVSGAHNAAFDLVCDVLERALGAERAVIPGAGHSVPRVGDAFNRRLEHFLAGAPSAAKPGVLREERRNDPARRTESPEQGRF